MNFPTSVLLLLLLACLATAGSAVWLAAWLANRFLAPRLAGVSYGMRLVLSYVIYLPTLIWFLVLAGNNAAPNATTLGQMLICLVLVGVAAGIPGKRN
jgi:hypothetical protein